MGKERELAADEAGVERAREADVGGALDEGTAVGEDGDCVGRVVEAKEKAVGADLTKGVEACLECGEIDGAVVLVDLDGIAAAEGDVGALIAGEGTEDALAADFAVGAGPGGGDFGAGKSSVGFGTPEIKGEEGATHQVGLCGEELEGFGDLNGGGEVDGGGEDAGGVAGFYVAGGSGGEDTGETGGGGVGESVSMGRMVRTHLSR